ncbi:MAG: DUF6624 domain-containing protein [Bacteroidota bacterium]
MKPWLTILLLVLNYVVLFSQTPNRLNKQGKRTGKWATYMDSAKKIKSFEGRFRNGRPIGRAYFYNNDGVIDRREINRFKKLKTTFYYANGITRMQGQARLENLPDRIHYYFYGKWKAYNEEGELIKYYFYKNGELLKTVYTDKNNKTNDSLIEALHKIDKEFTNNNVRLTDSINANKRNTLRQIVFKNELKLSDSLSFMKIDRIMTIYGYPSRLIVGDVSVVPFYILGFAPSWLKEKHLNILKIAADKQEISWKSLAFFIDKLKVAKGEKQLYGTQYFLKKDEYVTYPIEDMDHLNERRAGVGLEPFEP